MKFVFRLEKVLQQRNREKEEAQRMFHEAQKKLTDNEEILQSMLNQKTLAFEKSFQIQTQAVNPVAGLDQIQDFKTGQVFRIERQRDVIANCERIVEEMREFLRGRAIECKILERLKEKKLEEFKDERNDKQTKENDDISVMRNRFLNEENS